MMLSKGAAVLMKARKPSEAFVKAWNALRVTDEKAEAIRSNHRMRQSDADWNGKPAPKMPQADQASLDQMELAMKGLVAQISAED